jgi:hypothetical protein
MLRRTLPLAVAFTAVALTATAARADQIGYGYDFQTPAPVTGDDGNLGAVSFATTNPGHASGHALLTAASLAVVTAAPLNNPDTFSGQTYNVAIDLTDDASGKTGSLNFIGKLFGSLTPVDANITTSFDPPTKTLVLGNDKYTVTLGPLVQPDGNNPTVVGTLMATVDVQAVGLPVVEPAAQAPEPSALLLAGLGVAAALARRRGRPATV